jgi:hypothetical protein
MANLDNPTTGAESTSGARFRERLMPSPWLWPMAIAAGLFLGVAYGFALGPAIGVLTTVLVAGTGLWIVGRLVVVLSVEDDCLRAGRAHLPVEFVGRVRALDAESTARARGPGGDANAFLLLRTGYAKTAVAVEVTDPRDPHSYWLISSRRPDDFVSAMMSATDRAQSR